MNRVALFVGYGLFPIWGSIIAMFIGAAVSRSSEYWTVAPWLLIVAIPVCGFTLAISGVTLAAHARAAGDTPRKFKKALAVFVVLNIALLSVPGTLWFIKDREKQARRAAQSLVMERENLVRERENLVREREIQARRADESLATEFVNKHPQTALAAGPGFGVWNPGRNSPGQLPMQYEIKITSASDKVIYAIVDAKGESGHREFSLRCLTETPVRRMPADMDPCDSPIKAPTR